MRYLCLALVISTNSRLHKLVFVPWDFSSHLLFRILLCATTAGLKQRTYYHHVRKNGHRSPSMYVRHTVCTLSA